MVQVDVFWSFAIGAGFAASAARHLKAEDKPFESRYFVQTLLYLSILFVPSGATLLWGFPEWETMQVGRYETIPAWLVGLFTITNITQGILGYWVGYKCVRAGKVAAAVMWCLFGYLCMFFILVHGWDGTGYQRFFYSCTWYGSEQCNLWNKGDIHVFKWLVGPVALTLYAMGVVMVPLLLYMMSRWIKTGYELAGEEIDQDRARQTTLGRIIVVLLRLVFVHALGGAIAASLLVRFLGWFFGVLVLVVLVYAVEVRPAGLIHREVRRLTLEKEV